VQDAAGYLLAVDAAPCSRDHRPDESDAPQPHALRGIPGLETLGEFDIAASSIPRAAFDCLASLERTALRRAAA
jgi:hypothetical protein